VLELGKAAAVTEVERPPSGRTTVAAPKRGG
jgi:hypothetical protein